MIHSISNQHNSVPINCVLTWHPRNERGNLWFLEGHCEMAPLSLWLHNNLWGNGDCTAEGVLCAAVFDMRIGSHSVAWVSSMLWNWSTGCSEHLSMLSAVRGNRLFVYRQEHRMTGRIICKEWGNVLNVAEGSQPTVPVENWGFLIWLFGVFWDSTWLWSHAWWSILNNTALLRWLVKQHKIDKAYSTYERATKCWQNCSPKTWRDMTFWQG
jgi:hypothetical protein